MLKEVGRTALECWVSEEFVSYVYHRIHKIWKLTLLSRLSFCKSWKFCSMKHFRSKSLLLRKSVRHLTPLYVSTIASFHGQLYVEFFEPSALDKVIVGIIEWRRNIYKIMSWKHKILDIEKCFKVWTMLMKFIN